MNNREQRIREIEQRICEIEERLAFKDLTVQEAEELRYELADLEEEKYEQQD